MQQLFRELSLTRSLSPSTHSLAVLPLNCKFGKLYVVPTFTRPRSIPKEGVPGQGLFIKRERKCRKEGEEENKLPGSHSSAVTCQWQLTIDGPPGRMSKRESHVSSAD